MGPDQKEFPIRDHTRCNCEHRLRSQYHRRADHVGRPWRQRGHDRTARHGNGREYFGRLAVGQQASRYGSHRELIAGALALFVVSQMPLLFLHSYAAILICQILAGLPFPALNAGLLGFLYGKTPDNMQGRASAVFETTVGILGAACPAMAGWLLQQPDLGFTAVMAVAVVCSVVGLAVSLAGPLRSIPNPDQWSEVFL